MKKIAIFVMLIFIVPFIFASCLGTGAEKEKMSVKIDILKIGKADCIVINTGNHLIMIDTGEEENLSSVYSYMEENRYTKIDMLILTHYDKDHIGGAYGIISNYEVGRIIESRSSEISKQYAQYHLLAEEKAISLTKLTENYKFKYDRVEFEINIPAKKNYSEKSSNNSSLVVSMKCDERSFLFCGDAMEQRVSELISSKIGKHDLVKLPYHGNYIDNYSEFLDGIKPSYAVATDSGKNPISPDTVSVLEEKGIELYETRYGTVKITTDGKSINITQ